MKKTVAMLALLTTLLAGCKIYAPVEQATGKEDVAYLLFVSEGGAYKNKNVSVSLDGQSYEAKVVKKKTSNRRGTQYTAPTGTHQLTVSSQGQTLYSKKVFLSTQEVKTISLP
ncbi:MAG: hypothetical protein K5928_04795 [Prevotella sp.]|nr:hypothetical protein [Prevotella sp.]